MVDIADVVGGVTAAGCVCVNVDVVAVRVGVWYNDGCCVVYDGAGVGNVGVGIAGDVAAGVVIVGVVGVFVVVDMVGGVNIDVDVGVGGGGCCVSFMCIVVVVGGVVGGVGGGDGPCADVGV